MNRLRQAALLLAVGSFSYAQVNQPTPKQQQVSLATGGCIDWEQHLEGPQTAAARAEAEGSAELEALYPSLSTTDNPAITSGWTFARLRKLYPAAKLRMRDGYFTIPPIVEFSVGGKALFRVLFVGPGEALAETVEEVHPNARASHIETENPAFRTKAGVKPGMSVAAAAMKAGPAVLYQQFGITGADSLGEYLRFGRASPPDLAFSPLSYVATLPQRLGGGKLSWNLHVGPNGAENCPLLYWTRDIRPNGVIRAILISGSPERSATTTKRPAAAR